MSQTVDTQQEENLAGIAERIINQGCISKDEKDELSELGYTPYSDQGASRHVFRKDDIILKIPRNDHYMKINKYEVAAWRQAEGEAGGITLFCPVIAHGELFQWLKMPYCEPAPEKVSVFKDKYSRTDWVLEEIRPQNIGIFTTSDGMEHVVCFDYPSAHK